ncbi:DUF3135 domain-containing protein [Geobacter sp. DSM 9736]|uniref:DUF3135 domain-containing protein n=1 Tax=Geobacter sp. DSM 9736 TaxID=1277350 RepID=UPI000B507D43|nr:DUF3135 domain-containing protein [Geobacter sp. DSM 9736]SNB45236.1 Protein of unknown function [Geobacter sp. DSM 9736]
MEKHGSSSFRSYGPAELRELYERNPDLFNELAADAIRQACTGKSPEQTLKLRQMQWVIDSRLRKGKTPVDKLRIMENIFYDQVYGADGKLAQLSSHWTELLAVIGDDHVPGGRRGMRVVKKEKPPLPVT